MNGKEAILVTVVLFATFIGGAFADTISTAPTRATVQITSVDIGLFNPQVFNPQLGFEMWDIPSQLSSPEVNFTTAFAFAPINGFARVTSVALTIIHTSSIYLPSTSMAVNVGTMDNFPGVSLCYSHYPPQRPQDSLASKGYVLALT